MIWLHQVSPEFGLVSPKTLGAATGTTAVMVEDVDAHYRQALDEDAEIMYPPTDQLYGYREYSARDPKGGLWSFMKPVDRLHIQRSLEKRCRRSCVQKDPVPLNEPQLGQLITSETGSSTIGRLRTQSSMTSPSRQSGGLRHQSRGLRRSGGVSLRVESAGFPLAATDHAPSPRAQAITASKRTCVVPAPLIAWNSPMTTKVAAAAAAQRDSIVAHRGMFRSSFTIANSLSTARMGH